MRALLVINPMTRSATRAVLGPVTGMLSAELKLDVAVTTAPRHAAELAQRAVDEGYELVVALGGDGTLNEVVQAVARTPVRLGILPGGSTNVFARLLGLGRDPVRAAGALLTHLRTGRERVVNLGEANGRVFTFCSGWGYDAEVVRMVHGRPRMKRAVRQATFVYCGALAKIAGRADVSGVTVAADDAPPVSGLGNVVCCNADPYTYLGRLPSRMCPSADVEGGLDLTSLTRARTIDLLRLAATALTTDRVPDLPTVRTWHDHAAYTLTSPRPLPFHVDGEYVATTTTLHLRTLPDALTVVA